MPGVPKQSADPVKLIHAKISISLCFSLSSSFQNENLTCPASTKEGIMSMYDIKHRYFIIIFIFKWFIAEANTKKYRKGV